MMHPFERDCEKRTAGSFRKSRKPHFSVSDESLIILQQQNRLCTSTSQSNEICSSTMKHQYAIPALCWALLFLLNATPGARACSTVCHAPAVFGRSSAHDFHHRQRVARMATTGALVARKQLVRSKKPMMILAGVCVVDRIVRHTASNSPWLQSTSGDEDSAEEETSSEDKKSVPDEAMSTAMVASIGFYKRFISPLLPPACRFLPTCSQYGVQAIQEFGPSKGAILIAWRLARCSPFGGKGYDPPKWPPVAYTYGSY